MKRAQLCIYSTCTSFPVVVQLTLMLLHSLWKKHISK